ncbi:unnamed protein product [Auanema sp. JU1783]|nr:unnamed protein product [Auanema sp. JU1783]
MSEPMWSTLEGWNNFPYPHNVATSVPSATAPPPSTDIVKLEKVDYGDGYGPPPGAEGYPDPSAPQGMGQFYNMYNVGSTMGATHQLMPTIQHEQVKRDKEAIYNHPLYPLLSCLFEKCELATSTPRDQNRDGSPTDVCSSSSFKDDLNVFVADMQISEAYVPNQELDNLMLQSIQMLRFHLLELEKVHELCDNFCNRYVTCLKGKMPMDIVGDERASSSQPPLSPGSTAQSASPNMGTPMSHTFPPQFEPQTVPLPENTSAGMGHSMEGSSMGYQTPHSSQQQSQQQANQGQNQQQHQQDHPLAMGGHPTTAGAPHSLPLAAVSSPSASSSAGGIRHDSTPLSGDTPCPQGNGNPPSMDSVSEAGDELLSLCGSNEDGRESVLSDGQNGSVNGQKRKVPKVFSKEAITKFRAWLFQNLTHPYPSEEQKKQLASETGLTILQVNNWFINARRRIVQPMIDQSNRAGRGQQVNVFKNRRRNRSDNSPGPSPDVTDMSQSYSPDAAVQPTMPMSTYPPDIAYMQRNMFQTSYSPFPAPVMTPFMTPMMSFNPTSQIMTPANWMDNTVLGTHGME